MVFGDTVAVITGGVISEYQGQIQETFGVVAHDGEVLFCQKDALTAGTAQWEKACTVLTLHEIDMDKWRAEHPPEE